MTSRADYVAQVKSPGKFEGCAAYVPYFWDCYLDGGASEDYGRTLRFDVDSNDIAIFPELRDKEAVYLYESDSGFVNEVDGPGDDDFEMSNMGDDWGGDDDSDDDGDDDDSADAEGWSYV